MGLASGEVREDGLGRFLGSRFDGARSIVDLNVGALFFQQAPLADLSVRSWSESPSSYLSNGGPGHRLASSSGSHCSLDPILTSL